MEGFIGSRNSSKWSHDHINLRGPSGPAKGMRYGKISTSPQTGPRDLWNFFGVPATFRSFIHVPVHPTKTVGMRRGTNCTVLPDREGRVNDPPLQIGNVRLTNTVGAGHRPALPGSMGSRHATRYHLHGPADREGRVDDPPLQIGNVRWTNTVGAGHRPALPGSIGSRNATKHHCTVLPDREGRVR